MRRFNTRKNNDFRAKREAKKENEGEEELELEQIKAKKSLGQNFLKSESAIKEIVQAGEIKESDFILEIGPGKGDLTEKILLTGARVLAVEKDSRLIEHLKEKFKKFADRFQIIEEDILNFDSETIKEPYKLIANIPYYITGIIIRKFLEANNSPSLAVLLVQKEVAERIVSKNNKESLLSVSVKAYAKPEFIKTVKAGSFVPSPSVDSAILKINNISKENFINNEISEKRFFEIVKAGFAHNRKKVTSNLKNVLDKNELEKFLAKEKLNPSIRAEDINIDKWFLISKIN
jgi:16S rRNA (adenine1518-N6/adenine1519-N6)-dimethyltransferase